MDDALSHLTLGARPSGPSATLRPLPAVETLEVALELPADPGILPPVTAVRGTVILSSVQALREADLYDRYLDRIPQRFAAEVLGVIAGGWVPLELAWAHYRACDDLGLAPSVQVEIGRRAGKKATGTMLGTAVKLSRFTGATPWTLMKGGHRIWNRAYDGGGMRIFRVAPTEALVEAHKNPLLNELEFCRNSFRGFCLALYGLVSRRMSMRVVAKIRDGVVYRVVWQ